MVDEVGEAYGRRAAEYSEVFGSTGAAHPSDRQLIATWAAGIDGEVVDAGCGPGHWTDFLARRGLTARGVDLVPAFVARARTFYPDVPFAVGSLDDLDAPAGSLGGILSWYSLIHRSPGTIGVPLREFARTLRPGGGLLIGFFEGPVVEEFAHAVLPAYRWPVNALADEVQSAGFEVVETHVRTALGERAQAAIIARRSDD